ncbi:MAG TPA: hypothetical protein VJU87_07935 [Gemmatimonadaceae bacterium]|nr:hypothetical protein [Gemmatimonadaceae bacterium]
MLAAVMPPAAARGATIVLFVLAAFMIAMHSLLLGLAAQRTSLGARARVAAPALTAAFLAAWFAVADVVADQTNFPLTQTGGLLPLSLTVLLVPLVIAVAALFASRTMRTINAAMPSTWLIRLQTYRLAGFIFLFPFLAYGIVPAAFAVTAAVGDMLTGALAIPVARLVDRRGAAAFGWARAWNALGILDLVVVPTVAVLTGARVIGHYPIGTIALFIGPPLGILTHIYSLRNLAASASSAARVRPLAVGSVQHA